MAACNRARRTIVITLRILTFNLEDFPEMEDKAKLT